ncbi:MAG: hypothetical protein HY235_15865 [Acidobacteria bacterium]|nr:hypothetical protein [Acidobacteriota bacterium]
MASSHSVLPNPALPQPASYLVRGSLRFLLPSLSDCLFLAVFVWLFATGSGGWSGLLSDGDTGWHIRTGEWILEHNRVPKTDLFSFSRQDEPWFAWEWLSDVLYAKLHQTAGLKGLILVSALVISAFGTLLFRHMIWRGATPFAALLASLLVFGASSIHYLARPHVFTLLGITVAMWVMDADRRRPGHRIWLLAPLTVIWVNTHGGFLALIACLGLLVAGTAAETALEGLAGRSWNWQPVRRYALLALLCGLLTLVNPYGWKLHAHVLEYLRSDWIKDVVQEFQSPSFRTESMLHFEVMLFAGLMTSVWLLSKRELVGPLWILFWAHSALTSVRHVPLFMIVAAPWVAEGLTALWHRVVDTGSKKTIRGILASLAADMVPACRRSSLWIVAAALAFAVLPEPVTRWPKDFPAEKFPARMVERHGEKMASGRTLTMDQWGDYLIYRQYPRQKVFVDGRSDFFGKELGNEYLRMMQGHWEWERLVDKHRFEYVLTPVDWPLASLLKHHPGWRLADDDGMALFFERVQRY